jgi:large subunit ribosomal protein L4
MHCFGESSNKEERSEMSEAPVYNLSGQKVGTYDLSDHIFGAEINEKLLTQAVYVYRENQRQYNANTKVRSEISGGGRKPWKQKGTGRARQGSTRAAQWKGGAMVFGPRSVDRMDLKLTRKMRVAAIMSAFSKLSMQNKVYLIDSIEMKNPSTKQIAEGVHKMIEGKKVLVLNNDSHSNFYKAARNISNFCLVDSKSVNVYDLLLHDALVIPKTVMAELESRYPKIVKKAAKKTEESNSPQTSVKPVTAKTAVKKTLPKKKSVTQKGSKK